MSSPPQERPTCRVLMVEGSPADARALQKLLIEDASTDYRWTYAARLDQALRFLDQERFDVILSDLSAASEGGGNNSVMEVHAKAPGTPLLVLSPPGFLSMQRTGGADGLVEDLPKGDLFLIARAVRSTGERERLRREVLAALERVKKINEDLERANRYKAEFLVNMSHDLRSPLASTKEFLSLILDGLAGDITAAQREYLEIAHDNINHVARMIQGLFEVSRFEAKKVSLNCHETDLANVVQFVVSSLLLRARECEIALASRVEDGDFLAYVDSEKITETLLNLVDNAFKFTPKGGKVSLTLRGFSQNAMMREILVADTGRGMHPEVAEHIFERFYQGRTEVEPGAKGLGLGLFIVKEIVEAHYGKIWVESQPGKGSTFHITLPVFDYFVAETVEQTFLRQRPTACSLLAFEIGEREGRERAEQESAIHEARLIIEKSLRATDVVLPAFYGPNRPAMLLSLVMTDNSEGLERLRRRIGDNFERSPFLTRAGSEKRPPRSQIYTFPAGLCYAGEVLRKIEEVTQVPPKEG